MDTPRQAAVRALVQVFQGGAYSNLATEKAFDGLVPRDRAFAHALLRGVLERAPTLDWAIDCYSKTKTKDMSPVVREILRCGVYQLLYMPSVPPSAAVNEAVSLAKDMGEAQAGGFINGVLRAFLRGEKSYPPPKDRLLASAVASGVPAPLIAILRRSYGAEKTDSFLEACQTPPPLFARVNTLKTTPEKLMETLAAQGAEARLIGEELPNALELVGVGNPAALPAFGAGLFHIQDISSQRCAARLEAAPGMDVLDLCAAPGGKSFTISQEMEDRGRLVARDLHPHRVALIEEGARRLGLTCLSTGAGDARVYDPALGAFDRVLCDVVCSGYGVVRRKPEIRYKHPQGLDGMREPQYNILCTASKYLRSGGRLVYATCTLRPQENEEIVEAFLEAHPHFALYSPMETLIPGWEGWRGDGFFTAVLERRD